MLWGAWAWENTKTRQTEGEMRVQCNDFGSMVGEISPDITFWEGRQKIMFMGSDRSKLVRMGVNGHMGMQTDKSKAKRVPNGREGDVFRCMFVAKKNRKTIRTIILIREDQGKQCRVDKGYTLQVECIYEPKKQENKQRCKTKQ